VVAVVLAVQADAAAMSAQPNYLFTLQQQKNDTRNASDDALQYAVNKLRLTEAHQIAMGGNVLVAIIDSDVDTSHPELDGTIVDSFDTIGGSHKPDSHGTAIAGLIVAHAKLMGAAPAARILAARAFETVGTSTAGSTFNVLKGLDWGAVRGARIVNMSFAGPSDPAIHRAMESADRNGIVLIAAAGNAGPKSPPLYPGADPLVVAVTATDAQDKYFAASNRGRYIGLAAPGVDILVAAPGARYQISSGTSFSAAEVSGITALILEHRPNLSPDSVKRILLATGRPLPPEGAHLVDAWQAVSTDRLVLPVVAR
jgi:subtilisin family serine protease